MGTDYVFLYYVETNPVIAVTLKNYNQFLQNQITFTWEPNLKSEYRVQKPWKLKMVTKKLVHSSQQQSFTNRWLIFLESTFWFGSKF